MTFKTKLAATVALIIAAAAPLPALALDDAQKKEIGEFIKEYLVENPEILVDVQEALQKKQEEQQQAKAQSAITDNEKAIFSSPYDIALGNPKGDVTIVEFFDYNCGYCKRALADMQELIKNDPKLKVVLKEFPVLGPGSVEAAQVAVAVRLVAPDKYYAFHQKLLGDRGQANKAKALAAAAEVGVDTAALEKKLADPEINATLQESLQIADQLGIDGTPSYVVGDSVIVGAVGHDQIRGALDSMRKCGKAQC